jgi:subtilisin family serine protease
MFDNYIVLSLDKPQEEIVNFQGGSFDISIEKDLGREKMEGLIKNNKEIVGVYPDIPIQLIQPLDIPGQQEPVKGATTWGVEAVGAHLSPYTGKGVKIAVLDSGIDKTHPCFPADQVKINEMDFTGEGNGDTVGHGTHCAGTIFGRDVDGTRIGVAPGVTDVLIGKVIGKNGGSSGGIVQAIQWAVMEGAHIISMSLGIDFPGLVKKMQDRGMKPQPATSIALEAYRKNILMFEKMTALIGSLSDGGFSQPVLMVAAAGNENKYPDYEIAVSPPAISEGILSVGALGKNEKGFYIAEFSNKGPVLSAPGVNILSAKVGGGLTAKNGTSMATPHVAGVAALWAERMMSRKQFNAAQLVANLRAFVSITDLQNEDAARYGEGMVQAPRN